MKFRTILILLCCTISLSVFAQLNGSGFYRLKNASTGHYINLVNDSIDFQAVVGAAGGVSAAAQDPTKCFQKAAFYLNMDINLIPKTDTYTEPGTVLYLSQRGTTSTTKNDYNIISQGVGLLYITTGIYFGTNAGLQGSTGFYVTLTKRNDNTYTASMKFEVDGTSLGVRFLNENSTGKLELLEVTNNASESAPVNATWYIEPINTTDNYFTLQPSIEFEDKFYTTFRSPFSFIVPAGMTAYKVDGDRDLEEGDLLSEDFLSPYNQGDQVPCGQPVIIECSSSGNNIIKPSTKVVNTTASFTKVFWKRVYLVFSTYTLESATCNIVNEVLEGKLYTNYGRHGHDTEKGRKWGKDNSSEFAEEEKYRILYEAWGTKGDGIGFFSTAEYKGSNPLYKFGTKDGAVGFWEQVANGEKISGNKAYSPVQCQLFPVEKTLADIAEDGKEGISYDVIDNYLYGVRVVNGKLYAKDYGKFRNPNAKGENEIDGMGKFYNYTEDYDQSNWVVLDVADASEYVGKDLHVVGKLINRENPEIKVTKIEKYNPQISTYGLNVYCPASFTGTQESEVNHNTYFFVQPKPQELAHINWAVYGGNGNFYVNSPEGGINTAHIKGGFHAEPDLLPSGSSMDDFEVGQSYEFDAVINIAESTTNSKLRGAYVDGGISNNYVVYPLSSNQIVTGTTTLETRSNVTEVKYYNVMGVESSVPFKGVNIVVTTYDNGTRSTSKIVR